jgi:hypothetical protein
LQEEKEEKEEEEEEQAKALRQAWVPYGLVCWIPDRESPSVMREGFLHKLTFLPAWLQEADALGVPLTPVEDGDANQRCQRTPERGSTAAMLSN